MQFSRTGLQWTIIVFNTLCVTIGILCVVESVFELQKYYYGSPDFTEKIVHIAIGSILVISAFVGCFAAVNGSVKMLTSFVVMLLTLISSHIWMLWRYDEFRVRRSTEVMVHYTWLTLLAGQGTMDGLQEAYECCGLNKYEDYKVFENKRPPDSCYYYQNTKRFYPFDEGCLSATTTAYLYIYRMEKWAHVSLIGFELLGITLCFVLIYNLTADTRRYNY